MGRYLVVGNQILDGEALLSEVRRRQEKEPSSFYVVVPNTRTVDYYGFPAAGGHVPTPTLTAHPGPVTDEEATAGAGGRLGWFLGRLRDLGAQAEGELGGPDPLKATTKVLGSREFDEIIISQLPRSASRWRRRDLPRQLQQRSGLPVTVVSVNM